LFAWEEELIVECSYGFKNYFLQENVNIHGGYSVKEAYHYISKEDLAEALEHKEMI
jgi:hypothetical protein